MVRLFIDSVRRNGLDQEESLRRHPIIIQSFDENAIRAAGNALPMIPRVLLLGNSAVVTEARI
jgi:hypothetical protein